MIYEAFIRKVVIVLFVVLVNIGVFVMIDIAKGSNESGIVNKDKFIPIPLETRIIGSNKWLSDSEVAIRIVTLNHETGEPIVNSKIIGSLSGEGIREPIGLFRARTNSQGTANIRFRVPTIATGKYELTIKARTEVGYDEIREPITIEKQVKIMLTTDKPLYQPNQVIHLRALALKKPKLEPIAGEQLTFEIMDPKGNKVFKKVSEISKFGIANTEFQLADEINLGTYIVKAIIKDKQDKEIAVVEKKVNVQRYVLPKFKVQIKANKSYYMPGEILKGNLQVDYFFGKSVAEGKVTVKLSSFDFEWNEFAKIEGSTDERGAFDFEVKLPEYFAGIPLEKGNALIKAEAVVIDKADHQESAVITLPVSKNALIVNVIPDNTVVAAYLKNRFYILASYPDGKPAKTQFVLKFQGEEYKGITDESGIGKVELKPKKGAPVCDIAVKDDMGNKVEKRVNVSNSIKEEAVLLHIDKVIAKVGDIINLRIFSTKRVGTVFIDVVHDNQTYLTRSVDTMDWRAKLDLELDQSLAGTVLIHAYQIASSGNIIRDTKIVYINPVKDLKVAIETDKKTYLPGKEATIRFKVTDMKGHPVLAALGLTIVDESVFAIEEMHPGLEKIYFTLEQELLKPKYEIHGFDPVDVIYREPEEEPKIELNDGKQEVARVLFAAAMPAMNMPININTYTKRVENVRKMWEEYVQKSAEKIWKAIERYKNIYGSYPKVNEVIDKLLKAKLLTRADVKDPLGNLYVIKSASGDSLEYGITLVSGGLDGKTGTKDDVYGYSYRRQVVFGLAVVERAAPAGEAPKKFAEVKEFEADKKQVAESKSKDGQEQVYIRKFFPETLLVNPALITDNDGRAVLRFKMADSITTWRGTVLASSMIGQLGSTTFPMRVFQDFFIDIDFPVSLTQNDEISVPIAIYNYLPKEQSVRLKVEKEDWFELLSEPEIVFKINAGDVSVRHFRIRVKEFGRKQFTVFAYGEKMNDAIRREIEIIPDGREVWETVNDRLEGNIEKTITIPSNSIEGASNIIVKIYPGAFSQLVEGLDKLLRMPFGCFEQTSSVTYPNVLVTDYMKRTKKINPELQMKAEQYINLGYQRLLTFEVKGGGFSWFGDPPANKVLTAYGVMEFSDMAKVHDVDPNVIQRTINWLVSQQSSDGSWNPDQGGIAEGVINRQTDTLRTTAYIAWALVEAGYEGNAINNSVDYIAKRIKEVDDAYALAVIANALVGWNKKSETTRFALDRLIDMAKEEANIAYWRSKAPTSFGGKETTGDLETTALAAYALLKSGSNLGLASKALTYLIQNKDAFGTWQSTQATIWSLKALIFALQSSKSDTNAKFSIIINGEKASSFDITPEDSDVLRQVDLKKYVKTGANNIKINMEGKGSALYQISSKYYLPWSDLKEKGEPLSIDIKYDRKELSVNDILRCSVRVVNNQNMTANMVIVDLGLPPGFDVLSEDLTALVEKKIIEKYSLTGRQIIIYLNKVYPKKPIEFTYRLKAKFPIKAKTTASKVYEYYSPAISGKSAPQDIEVK